MARYVIANRRAGMFTTTEKVAARASVAEAVASLASAQIVEDNNPADETARRVTIVEADAAEVAERIAHPAANVIIEPEIMHWISGIPPLDLGRAAPAETLAGLADAAAQTVIEVHGGNGPLRSCGLTVFFRGFAGTQKLEGRTDAFGRFAFSPIGGSQIAAVVAVPAGDHWPMIFRGAQAQGVLHCPVLPRDGPLGWWHDLLGSDAGANLGRGIRVGIIDTGLADHVCLSDATPIGSFIDGSVDSGVGATIDLDGHGTHVAGTIGGRARTAGQYAGIAPGADLFAARVFPPGKGATNADIANAIDALSRGQRVDLINMSLSSSQPSEVVHDAIIDAFERGTICLVAAGNEAGSVRFPAAFPESVAVSALGLAGWGPPGSISAGRLPQQPDRFGRNNLYLANFSCFGPELDCTAPGVGIIAPVCDPDGSNGFFGAMDGTSMATPAACGALAAKLSLDPNYLRLPRSAARAHAALAILRLSCRDIGLATSFQGRGVPSIR